MLKFLHAPNTRDTFHRYTYIWKVGREFKVALKFSSVLHLISSKAWTFILKAFFFSLQRVGRVDSDLKLNTNHHSVKYVSAKRLNNRDVLHTSSDWKPPPCINKNPVSCCNSANILVVFFLLIFAPTSAFFSFFFFKVTQQTEAQQTPRCTHMPRWNHLLTEQENRTCG